MASKKIDSDMKQVTDDRIIKTIKNHKFKRYEPSADESKKITQYFGENVDVSKNSTENMAGKLLFFYVPPRFCKISDKANKHLRQYEEDLKLKLGMHKVYHTILSKMKIHNHIDTAKLAEDGSLDNEEEIKKTNLTFSYDKLKRLKNFYQLLVEFTLQIIHTFMYIDTQNVKSRPMIGMRLSKMYCPLY